MPAKATMAGSDGGLPRAAVEAQFAALLRGGRPALIPGRVQSLDEAELRELTRHLARLRHECGCRAGAWSMAVALIVALPAAVLHGASDVAGGFMLAGVCAAGTVLASVLGKLTAVVVARVR